LSIGGSIAKCTTAKERQIQKTVLSFIKLQIVWSFIIHGRLWRIIHLQAVASNDADRVEVISGPVLPSGQGICKGLALNG
jgi:hypothetical protein